MASGGKCIGTGFGGALRGPDRQLLPVVVVLTQLVHERRALRKHFRPRGEQRHDHHLHEASLVGGRVGPGQRPVHQRRHLPSGGTLEVALREELLLQAVHPYLVDLQGESAVAQVRHLHGHLQHEQPLGVAHLTPLVCCAAQRPQLGILHHLHLELAQQVIVAAHVGGEHRVDDHPLEPLALGGGVAGAFAKLINEVHLWLHQGTQRLAQRKVLSNRLVVEVRRHWLLLVNEEGIVDLRVSKVVHHGSHQAHEPQ
mmetsp:Transcript_11970/g.30251  ORF Transcript_11970/g.30251 Transcript_11970/m.30251 type:complete len:255 (-) Transcript_11970:417-1181(-)